MKRLKKLFLKKTCGDSAALPNSSVQEAPSAQDNAQHGRDWQGAGPPPCPSAAAAAAAAAHVMTSERTSGGRRSASATQPYVFGHFDTEGEGGPRPSPAGLNYHYHGAGGRLEEAYLEQHPTAGRAGSMPSISQECTPSLTVGQPGWERALTAKIAALASSSMPYGITGRPHSGCTGCVSVPSAHRGMLPDEHLLDGGGPDSANLAHLLSGTRAPGDCVVPKEVLDAAAAVDANLVRVLGCGGAGGGGAGAGEGKAVGPARDREPPRLGLGLGWHAAWAELSATQRRR